MNTLTTLNGAARAAPRWVAGALAARCLNRGGNAFSRPRNALFIRKPVIEWPAMPAPRSASPRLVWSCGLCGLCALIALALAAPAAEREWLAGDSHIHSHWSTGYDYRTSPPTPIKGRDADYSTPYSTPRNAAMARRFGLRWMVTTDHGGPYHSKVNLEQAHRELTLSRELVPEVLQFYGMELNMPGMDHHTLIIPRAEDEASVLHEIESRFDADEDWARPPDPRRRSAALRRQALAHMQALDRLPILFANHPSRTARGIGLYGFDEPWEIRENNDLAPDVYRGMEGAPGHQANTFSDQDYNEYRGLYRLGGPTLGGFDQMTAVVGGLWDALLGEGRRFWIVASSDFHSHYNEPASLGGGRRDFWPGEFHKTWVEARPTYADVLDGLRQGRVFAVAGDLVTEFDVRLTDPGGHEAGLGGTLRVARGAQVTAAVRFRDPETPNGAGENPGVRRVDVIVGDVREPPAGPSVDRNPTTRVLARFTREVLARDGDRYALEAALPAVDRDLYVRVRGTSTDDLEPRMDGPGENPWHDLWFYSNPIFIEVE